MKQNTKRKKGSNYLQVGIIFLLFIQISCNITKDSDCIKQKQDQDRCLRAFTIFCAGNKNASVCDGSVNSILTIGVLCNVGAVCKANTDNVVTEKIQSGNTQ